MAALVISVHRQFRRKRGDGRNRWEDVRFWTSSPSGHISKREKSNVALDHEEKQEELGVTDGGAHQPPHEERVWRGKNSWRRAPECAYRSERRPAGPQDASREATNDFKRDIEKFMDSDAAGDMRSKEVAEKVWQANQSGYKKAENLDKNLLNILLALKKCGWEKDLDESTKIRAERR